jgi:type VI secretion system protein ImpA
VSESDQIGLGGESVAAAPQDSAQVPATGADGAPVEAAPAEAASAGPAPADQPKVLDPAVARLSTPISEADPCGPDLDAEGDSDYLNFFAQVDGVLPTSFFSPEDGKPFDPATVDIDGQFTVLRQLLARSRDVRLIAVQARLAILNRDLAGFAVAVAVIAEWLERFWDTVHPRPEGGSVDARQRAIAALDMPTVVFPLQYVPFLDARRIGPVTYRRWLIATGEAKPRDGDAEVSASAIAEALDEADGAILTTAHKHIALLNASLARIGNAWAAHGSSADLKALPALVGKMLAFIEPYAARHGALAAGTGEGVEPLDKDGAAAKAAVGPPPASIAEATQALAAIADYYGRCEPSSPSLPLVRQAHQLVGKSFFEIMTILVPSQVDKAAFQIGTDHVFDLPLEKLASLSVVGQGRMDSMDNGFGDPAQQFGEPGRPQYRVESRAQAVALLDMVQRYFRLSEPSSPVPMLCDRARALAERDFMGVLRDVLPKSALKNINADK